MNWLTFHFASGDAFFTGSGLLITALVLSLLTGRFRRVARVMGLVGAIIIALSATPLNWWFYGVWLVVLAAPIVICRVVAVERQTKITRGVRSFALIVCVLAVVWELSYRVTSRLPEARFSKLYVIGDSITAGMLGPEEQIWPRQFRETFKVVVVDLSQEGATARSAQKQATRIEDDAALVFIEIGGNDLLGHTSAADFRTDLDQLLKVLKHPQRTLVMLELPLPPLYNEFGRIQRELAARYDVHLIPKRRMMSVFAADAATVDGLHLSESGHKLMAEMVWSQVGGLLESR